MADSLCTYMASGQRSHKGMCPGLAQQYFLMPDTETFIGCPCTILLSVPTFYIYFVIIVCMCYYCVVTQSGCSNSYVSMSVYTGWSKKMLPILIKHHFILSEYFSKFFSETRHRGMKVLCDAVCLQLYHHF